MSRESVSAMLSPPSAMRTAASKNAVMIINLDADSWSRLQIFPNDRRLPDDPSHAS